MSILVADAQFGNLAGAARGGVLVALAAGLRVIQRSETVGEMLDLLERVLVRGVGRVVNEAITFVIEPRRSFGNRRRKRKKPKGQKSEMPESSFMGTS